MPSLDYSLLPARLSPNGWTANVSDVDPDLWKSRNEWMRYLGRHTQTDAALRLGGRSVDATIIHVSADRTTGFILIDSNGDPHASHSPSPDGIEDPRSSGSSDESRDFECEATGYLRHYRSTIGDYNEDPTSEFPLRDGTFIHRFLTDAGTADQIGRRIPWEALMDVPYCVITGDPGMGKTSLARRLGVAVATRDPGTLPVYVQLRDAFIESGFADLGALRDRYAVPSSTEEQELFIILDGYDEVPPRHVGPLNALLGSLVQSRARVVITSRVSPQPLRLASQVRRYELLPLSKNESIDLASRLIGTSSAPAKEFLGWLAAPKALDELLGSPLAVRRWCEFYSRYGARQLSLFQGSDTVASLLLHEWDERRSINWRSRDLVLDRRQTRWLSAIGHGVLPRPDGEFTLSDAVRWCRLDESRDPSAAFTEVTKFLEGSQGVIFRSSSSTWRFRYRLFVNLFYASYLINMGSDVISTLLEDVAVSGSTLALACAQMTDARSIVDYLIGERATPSILLILAEVLQESPSIPPALEEAAAFHLITNSLRLEGVASSILRLAEGADLDSVEVSQAPSNYRLARAIFDLLTAPLFRSATRVLEFGLEDCLDGFGTTAGEVLSVIRDLRSSRSEVDS